MIVSKGGKTTALYAFPDGVQGILRRHRLVYPSISASSIFYSVSAANVFLRY